LYHAGLNLAYAGCWVTFCTHVNELLYLCSVSFSAGFATTW